MNMTNIWFLMFFVVFILPWVVYISAKAATVGFFRGKRLAKKLEGETCNGKKKESP